MNGDQICYNGEIIVSPPATEDIDVLLGNNFIYQRIHTLKHEPLFFDELHEIANTSYNALYGCNFGITAQTIKQNIKLLLAKNRYPKGSVVVTWYMMPPTVNSATSYILSVTKQLVYEGYVHWHARLNTIILPYEYPFQPHKSAVSLAANNFAQWYAKSKGADAALTQNYEKQVISAGENPLFAVRNRQVITTPIVCAASDSVERRLGIAACKSTGLHVVQEPIMADELSQYDELFLVNQQGIESIRSCDFGAPYSHITAQLIAEKMSKITTI